MDDYKKIAHDLVNSLQLSQEPIAVSLTDNPPPDVSAINEIVPAGCSFWELAGRNTFYTSPKHHELCSIGIYTHNLVPRPPSHQSELHDTLQAMAGLDYVRSEEIAAIPVIPREVKHVVYGPLRECNSDPDLVLIFAQAHQSLILTEATARVDHGHPPAMGRPACAIVPQVLTTGRAAMSLGCCGARAYLKIFSDDKAVWAFPGSELEKYFREIVTLARANTTLSAFHANRNEDIKAGARPTVRQSFNRLES